MNGEGVNIVVLNSLDNQRIQQTMSFKGIDEMDEMEDYTVKLITENHAITHNISFDSTMNDTFNKSMALPADMTFNEGAVLSVAVYCVLFVISASGNLTVFITLFRNRHRRSRVNRFILHLAAADLIVTFIMMPLEVAWNVTVAWRAGDVMCRVMMYFRAFGFYLSSSVLVAISLDRYFAILHPLSMNDANRRGRMMISAAWCFSLLASIPQSVIFHLEYHPIYPWFAQCVTFNFFPSPSHELAYNIFNLVAVYGLPLCIIVVSYLLILVEVSRKTKQSKDSMKPSYEEATKLRRSGVGQIEKARLRTLKMTIVIVMVFVLCWTPYFVISAWWWFDQVSADNVDPKVQRALFLFAVSNSCVNPLVYGMFTINLKKELENCCGLERRDSSSILRYVKRREYGHNGTCLSLTSTPNSYHNVSMEMQRLYDSKSSSQCFITSTMGQV